MGTIYSSKAIRNRCEKRFSGTKFPSEEPAKFRYEATPLKTVIKELRLNFNAALIPIVNTGLKAIQRCLKHFDINRLTTRQ